MRSRASARTAWIYSSPEGASPAAASLGTPLSAGGPWGSLEKEDFAFGTSSRSSKIVHGGVRYLEYGHFLLVKEAPQERAVLLLFSPNFRLAGAGAAADIMSQALGWDTDRRAQELAEYRELAAEHTLPST